MFDEKTLLILIPAMPLTAAVITAALGKRVLRRQSHWPTVVAIGISCVASMLLVLKIFESNFDFLSKSSIDISLIFWKIFYLSYNN